MTSDILCHRADEQGIVSRHVAQWLGHSSITVTLDVCSHVMPDMQWAAIAGLDDALFGT